MDINPTKATFLLASLHSVPEDSNIVLHQDDVINNLSPTLMFQTVQSMAYIGRKTASELSDEWRSGNHSGNRNLGLLAGTAMNYSFAAELGLKGILLMTQGGFNQIHRLDKLFNKLSDDIKEELETSTQESLRNLVNLDIFDTYIMVKSKPNAKFEINFKYSRVPTINQFLDEHNSPFVNWRYFFQFGQDDVQTIYFDIVFMDSFLVALVKKFGSYPNTDGKPLGEK
jgi:hypothetical protein